MKIVKLSNESIMAFKQNVGWLIRSKYGTVEIVPELKAIIPNGKKVFFCKKSGEIEPSYSTSKKYPDTLKEELMAYMQG